MKVEAHLDANQLVILTILEGAESPMNMTAVEIPRNITVDIVKIDKRGWISEEAMSGNIYQSLRTACRLTNGDVTRVMFYKDDPLLKEGNKLIINNCRLRNQKYFVLNSSSLWRLPKENIPRHLVDFCVQHVENPLNEYTSVANIQGLEANELASAQGTVIEIGSINVRKVEGSRNKRVRDMKIDVNSDILFVTLWDQCAELVICVGDFVKIQDCPVSDNKFFKTKGISCTYLDSITVTSGDSNLRMYYLLAYNLRESDHGRTISLLLDRLDIRMEVDICESMMLGALKCSPTDLENSLDSFLNSEIQAKISSGKVIELVMGPGPSSSGNASCSSVQGSNNSTVSRKRKPSKKKDSDYATAKPDNETPISSESYAVEIIEDPADKSEITTLIDLTDSDEESTCSSESSYSNLDDMEIMDGPSSNRQMRRSKLMARDAIVKELIDNPELGSSTDEDYTPPIKTKKTSAKKASANKILQPSPRDSLEDFVLPDEPSTSDKSLSLFSEPSTSTQNVKSGKRKRGSTKTGKAKDGSKDATKEALDEGIAKSRRGRPKKSEQADTKKKIPKKDASGGKNKKSSKK